MSTSSGLGGSIQPTSPMVDTVQDFQSFVDTLDVATPTATSTSMPDVPADAVKIRNCSPCPVLATFTLQAPAEKGERIPDPVIRKEYLHANEFGVLDFIGNAIVDVTYQELDTAGLVPGNVAVDGLSGLAAPTQDIVVKTTFLNS